MSWNWQAKPEDCVYMDIETQSLCNLKQEGGRKYAVHPSTRLSMAAFIKDDRRTLWFLLDHSCESPPGWEIHRGVTPPEWVLQHTFCAHNAGEFDKLVWDHCVKIEVPWIDSMPIARAAGLPGGLDKIGQILLGHGKDSRGYALINMLCVARAIGEQIVYPVCTPAAWNAFIGYCCQDVELLAEFFPMIHQYAEPEALRVHQNINDRGIPIDVDFAIRLVLLQEELKIKRAADFEQLSFDSDPFGEGVSASDIRSVKKVIAWLQRIGIQPPMKNGKPSLDRKELGRLFKEPEAYMDTGEDLDGAVEALKLRVEVTRATVGKAKAALRAMGDDYRARGQHVYNGAHTGRFSGRDLQPHNFLRGAKGVDFDAMCKPDLTLEEVEAEAARLSTPLAQINASDIIATLLRPMIGGKA